MSEENEVYMPAEAVEYLKNERGIIYTVEGLRTLRYRNRATTRRVGKNMALWTKAELDAIQPTSRTKRVKPVEEKKEKEVEAPVHRWSHVGRRLVAPVMRLAGVGL